VGVVVVNIRYAMSEIMNMEYLCAFICAKKAAFVKNIEISKGCA
jgi:hypothetical protein